MKNENKKLENELSELKKQYSDLEKKYNLLKEEADFKNNILVEKNNEIEAQNEEYKQINEELKRLNDQLHSEKVKIETQNEIFAQFMKNSPVYMFFKDANIRPISLSKNYEQMIGMPVKELLGKTMYELFPSDLAKKMVEDDLKILNEGKTIEVEEELDGKYYYTIKFPIKIDEKPTYLAGFTIDITDRKINEMKIAENESLFSKMFYKNPNLMAISTIKDGKYVDVNNAFLATLGFSKEDIIGKTSVDLKIWNNQEQRERIIKKFHEIGTLYNEEIEVFTKDKKIKYGLFSIEKIIYNNEPHLMTTMVDITKQKIVENQLRIFMEAIDNSSDAIGMSTPEGVHFYQNKSFDKLFGEIGKNPPETLYCDKNIGYEVFNKIIKGEKWKGNVEMFSAEKEIITVFLRAYPVKDENGKVKALLGLHNDISESITQQNIINQQNKQLIELNASREKFMSIIAHDLRNPFNSILNLSELIVENFYEHNAENIIKFASYIHLAADKTFKLLDNLLTWSRAQTGKINFEPQKVEISNLLKENIMFIKSTADNKKIKINMNLNEYFVWADILMTNTIIRNLLSNAVKYSKENGEIFIKTNQFDDNFIQICVSDNGIGIDERKLENIFSIFDFKSTRGTNNETGTGLGLIICKEFVERQNGKIWAESKIDEGTTFCFTLQKK